MINVFIVPFHELQLKNNLFKESPDGSHAVWQYIKDHLRQNGIDINTIDYWNDNDNFNNSIIIVIDHPHQIFLRSKIYLLRNFFVNKVPFKIKYYKFEKLLSKFAKKILFQFEPLVVSPGVYGILPKLSKLYNKIYLTSQIDGYDYFHMPQIFNQPLDFYFNNKRSKFLILMNSNKKPHSFKNELYSERLKALRYFSKNNEIDLYGDLWNRHIFFPYTFYKKYIKRVYKGYVEDKITIMSQYKFAICFENEISSGWITEKIFDCFLAGTIPIYYGAPNITDYIPADCFIDFRKFKDYKELKNYLFMLTDEDIDEYKKNILNYYKSGRFMQFSKEGFADKILHSIVNK